MQKVAKPTFIFLRLPFASPDLPHHRDLRHPFVLMKETAPPTHPSLPPHVLSASRLHRPTCLPRPPAELLFCFTFGHLSPPRVISRSRRRPPRRLPPLPPALTLSVTALSPQILAAYKALMERLLSMLGAHNATQKSKEIIQLETRLANVSQLP